MSRTKILVSLTLVIAVLPLLSHASFEGGESIPVDSYNNRVAESHRAGHRRWTQSALQVATEFVGDKDAVRRRSITLESVPKRFDRAEVTIIEDGYMDDSVKGTRYRLKMEKSSSGYWQVISASRDWKCQPGRGHAWWSCSNCD